jgi:kynurenine formamidase
MKITLTHAHKTYGTDLSKGIDLSSVLGKPGEELKAWGTDDVEISPVRRDGWVGSVKEGSPVNFFNIKFNPHGNGSHTETVGHIAPEKQSVNTYFKQHHLMAHLVHLSPKRVDRDEVILLKELQQKNIDWEGLDALIVRTGDYGAGHDFSNTNAPYFEPELLAYVRDYGIKHFLVDLPSVDREEDEGKLLAHHAFWNYPENPRYDATISELLQIPGEVEEGLYMLNLQTAAFENDAAPCRPVLFRLVAR